MAQLEPIFGLHAVQALLKSAPQRVQQLLVLRGRQDQRLQKVLAAAQKQQIATKQVDRKELDKLVEGNHQGVIAMARPGELHDEKFLYTMLENLDATPFLLVLDGVTDPHNLGACLRTAEAAGVHAVIAPKDNSASLNATARKVACGAAEVLPYISVTNLSRTLKKLQELGLWTIGTAGEAEQSVYQADLKGPMALVMGAEGKGMRRLTREHCDSLINIPMAGEVSSLNVSVATGVCLFEAVRQRS
ncbi:23S rRNA (guanosine(2251)-2'-O)-methyltransferase RlmB [Maricurvus nonylphenolicus]|uniref:23S rRNA (guanosine(2251)-2'-O)-methyltransferase RlmB n=1 Tax=Maricurvus nonylphenolicus TaxID=1008307 RepID=UPI0036F3D3F3